MGEDLSHQHPFDVLSDKSRSAAHEARQRHHHTASVNSDMPNPILLAYATTKGAIQNFTGGLAQMLAEKGIRANAVAPAPSGHP
jgi:NAD(P)-dependent dehydrogenase (short-subunit alcohol dehydrogenase family)